MIVEPEKYVKRFVEAGADYVTFHYEATKQIDECIKITREAGAKVGISIKPATPVSVLKDILAKVDLVLVMSVEPGFGGQSFMPDSLDKVRELAAIKREQRLDYIIEIDGGISAKNAGEVFAAGAEALVAGSAVFGATDPEAEIVKMLEA
jgi:ribulose-phosphate 3-epimerase